MKKFIWRRLFFVLALVLLVVGMMGFRIYHTDSKNAAVTSAPHARLYYQTAVQRGLDYLRDPSTQVAPMQWLLMDYLQRKFGLDSYFSATGKDIKPPTDPLDATEFQIHRRIAYPNQQINTLPMEGASPMRQMMMAATHCDHMPLPLEFDKLLQSNIDAGSYELTHVAYSLERMAENGCPLPDEEDTQMRQQVAERMVSLATDQETIPDLRYESIAFLMHMHRRDLVQPEWIDQIVAQQQSDGGWKITTGAQASSDHATVLALWALLEYINPDTPNEPVLRRTMP